MNIEAGTKSFEALNNEVKEALKTVDVINLENVCGQRYIAAGMDNGKTLNIYGIPGNDLCCYLNGGKVEVFGNVQDGVCNTMGNGQVIIHGIAGDALGYAMRGGEVYIEKDVGYRSGIHMKEFKEAKPVIVIGGKAGAFLGEYMAGGVIILLGLESKDNEDLAEEFCGTGIHGGVMYVRGNISREKIAREVVVSEIDENDMAIIQKYVQNFCGFFGKDYDKIMSKEFKKLKAISSRPYGSIYTGV